jgi:hypothetical protein
MKVKKLFQSCCLCSRRNRDLPLRNEPVHADPNGMPQAHKPAGRAITAPAYQEGGLFLALNEIAFPVALAALFVPNLLKYEDERKNAFENAARVLIEGLGGVNVMEKGRPWFKLH